RRCRKAWPTPATSCATANWWRRRSASTSSTSSCGTSDPSGRSTAGRLPSLSWTATCPCCKAGPALQAGVQAALQPPLVGPLRLQAARTRPDRGRGDDVLPVLPAEDGDRGVAQVRVQGGRLGQPVPAGDVQPLEGVRGVPGAGLGVEQPGRRGAGARPG